MSERPTGLDAYERTYLQKLIASAEGAQAQLKTFLDFLAGKYTLPEGTRVDPDGSFRYPPDTEPKQPPPRVSRPARPN